MSQKVMSKDLRIGMFVADLDRPWIDTPFLLQGFMIEDDEHPLIGDDVIHYAYLERTTALLARNSARPSHYLHALGYRAWQDGKTLRVNGERTKVFVHCDRFVEGLEDPVEVLESRSESLME